MTKRVDGAWNQYFAHPQWIQGDVDRRAGDQIRRRRQRVGFERASRRRGTWAVGGEVVHRGHQLDAFHSVDDAVVQLERYSERSLRHSGNGIQSLDDRHLPRGAAQVELASVDARDLDAQLAPVAGLRQGDVTDVVFEVEVRVVDPV